jgi:hypothetical protein
METQYGDPRHPPEAADVVDWLEWAKENAPRRLPARR